MNEKSHSILSMTLPSLDVTCSGVGSQAANRKIRNYSNLFSSSCYKLNNDLILINSILIYYIFWYNMFFLFPKEQYQWRI